MAATRARDLIVVPVGGDASMEGWLDVLDPALYPREDARRSPELGLGTPTFGNDSVLYRGTEGVPPDGGSVRPGLHQPRAGGPSVTWWDPALLQLDVDEQSPLRQQHILEADPGGTAATAGEESYARWKVARSDATAQASRPSLSVQTVTALARIGPADERIRVEHVARTSSGRPAGRRFGILVHSLLAAIDFDAGPEVIRLAAALKGRLVDATAEEIDAAATTVEAALGHPTMRLAAAEGGAGTLRRECPVLLRRVDGTLAEGVVDLAFPQKTTAFTGWTVVDFKTDREFEAGRANYTAQVGLYAEAIEKATNAPANGILLVI